MTIILNTVALVLAARHNGMSIEALRNQIDLQQENIAQSRPVDFRVDASIDDGYELRIVIGNRGDAAIDDVHARVRFYLLFPDGEIRSTLGLARFLSSDAERWSAVQASGLIARPNDIMALLGPSRLFFMRGLGGRLDDDFAVKAFRPELSQSAILNALRVAYLVNARVVLRWRFDYQHRVSRKRFTSYLYLLVTSRNSAESVLQVQPTGAYDLAESIGGSSVIDAIRSHEEESLEEIFPGGAAQVRARAGMATNEAPNNGMQTDGASRRR